MMAHRPPVRPSKSHAHYKKKGEEEEGEGFLRLLLVCLSLLDAMRYALHMCVRVFVLHVTLHDG